MSILTRVLHGYNFSYPYPIPTLKITIHNISSLVYLAGLNKNAIKMITGSDEEMQDHLMN